MIWFFTLYPYVILKTNKNSRQKVLVQYSPTFLFFIKLYSLKQWNSFVYISKFTLIKKFFLITIEHRRVFIKYVGKIFRISKKKKLIFLTLNYTGFNYVIWKNIFLRWQWRPKRYFEFFILTNKSLHKMFWDSIIHLRPLNTYTRRGVYNNLFTYYQRKRQKALNR